MIYKSIIKPLLFSFSSETIHDATLSLAEVAQTIQLHKLLQKYCFVSSANLEREVAGLKFANPIGLAAGFDKNCRAIPFLAALGFGHIEIGSVTAEPQSGNEKPRIFRLPDDKALINRMGFPSRGAEFVAKQLGALRTHGVKLPVIGVNLGKTKVVPIDQAVEDYKKSFQYFANLADYFVLNVSSPNTPDLRKLQEPTRLLELFQGINSINYAARPLFVKVAPDLSFEELDQILAVCYQSNIQGIIACNTTFDRTQLKTEISEAGGLSGAPLFQRALGVVKFLASRTDNKFPIIAVGGVSNGPQALEMLQVGARLVQIYTGLVYEGPLLVKRINQFIQNTYK